MNQVEFAGPAEPLVTPDGTVELSYVTEDTKSPGNPTVVKTVTLGTWECTRCGNEIYIGVGDGSLEEPNECASCERAGPFVHAGDVSEKDVQAAVSADDMWHPPALISKEGFDVIWHDVRRFIRQHWDASDEEIYHGLTAYALSTWVRENMPFLPHLMLMGSTTGGKTRLLNTLARVSYRAVVTASATPASMFRLVDGYNVSYFISEYHGLPYEAQQQVDNIVRAGQKRGEIVTRAEQGPTGYEPKVFDPFTHVAVATQYTPDDDIINRCIQIRSSPNDRDMPAEFDDDQALAIRNRLLYARYRLLESDTWADAEEKAYGYLAERGIDGRTREKLLGLLTAGFVWDHVDELEPFIDRVVEQDKDATADSEDALVVEAIRECAFDEVGSVTTLGDTDPFASVEIPYSKVTERYEEMTGSEESNTWLGHVRDRLGLKKERKRDGTVISDPDLGPKLRELCDDHNLEWESMETHGMVKELDENMKERGWCELCGSDRQLTHRDTEVNALVCSECAAEGIEI